MKNRRAEVSSTSIPLAAPDAVPECSHPDCSARPQTRVDFPLPLCAPHLVSVCTEGAKVMASSKGRGTPNKLTNHPAVVYYLRFGDRVKIGTTTNMDNRLRDVPHDEVLVMERGGHAMESLRHKQFASDRITGEWFRMSDRLMRHIERLQGIATKTA